MKQRKKQKFAGGTPSHGSWWDGKQNGWKEKGDGLCSMMGNACVVWLWDAFFCSPCGIIGDAEWEIASFFEELIMSAKC